MKLAHSHSKGFTLVEIMIVVAIIGILIAIAVPGFVKARTESRRRSCQENLSKIDGAKEQYALENNQKVGDTASETELIQADGSGYLKKTPICPGGGAYTYNVIGTDPACSLSAAPDNHLLP